MEGANQRLCEWHNDSKSMSRNQLKVASKICWGHSPPTSPSLPCRWHNLLSQQLHFAQGCRQHSVERWSLSLYTTLHLIREKFPSTIRSNNLDFAVMLVLDECYDSSKIFKRVGFIGNRNGDDSSGEVVTDDKVIMFAIVAWRTEVLKIRMKLLEWFCRFRDKLNKLHPAPGMRCMFWRSAGVAWPSTITSTLIVPTCITSSFLSLATWIPGCWFWIVDESSFGVKRSITSWINVKVIKVGRRWNHCSSDQIEFSCNLWRNMKLFIKLLILQRFFLGNICFLGRRWWMSFEKRFLSSMDDTVASFHALVGECKAFFEAGIWSSCVEAIRSWFCSWFFTLISIDDALIEFTDIELNELVISKKSGDDGSKDEGREERSWKARISLTTEWRFVDASIWSNRSWVLANQLVMKCSRSSPFVYLFSMISLKAYHLSATWPIPYSTASSFQSKTGSLRYSLLLKMIQRFGERLLKIMLYVCPISSLHLSSLLSKLSISRWVGPSSLATGSGGPGFFFFSAADSHSHFRNVSQSCANSAAYCSSGSTGLNLPPSAISKIPFPINSDRTDWDHAL